MILARRIESRRMITHRYDHFDSRKNKDYTSEDDIKLLVGRGENVFKECRMQNLENVFKGEFRIQSEFL